MRYYARVDVDRHAQAEGKLCASGAVASAHWCHDEKLALRHARALLAFVRAGKALTRASRGMDRAYERDVRVSAGAPVVQRYHDAQRRHERAFARLEKVEKEVRGAR